MNVVCVGPILRTQAGNALQSLTARVEIKVPRVETAVAHQLQTPGVEVATPVVEVSCRLRAPSIEAATPVVEVGRTGVHVADVPDVETFTPSVEVVVCSVLFGTWLLSISAVAPVVV